MTETAATEEATETPPEKNDALAERHGFVDFDKIEDPEVRKQAQDRIHGLYQSQKETAATLSEFQRMYAGMEKKLAEMEAKEQTKETNSQLTEVKKGIAAANARGEYEKAADLTEKMAELKAPKPKPETNDTGLTRQQESTLFAWQGEMTDDGRIARPWAHPSHPKYKETIAQLAEVSQDPQISSKGFGAVLDEVHSRMAPKPKQVSPVSDGDATPARQTGKTIQLSEGQKKAAIRMYSGAPYNLKPAEAIKRYAEAQKKYGDQ